MHLVRNSISLPIIILTLGFFSTTSLGQDSAMTSEDGLIDSELDFDKSPHDLGLGKRVYGYISEFKRLPVYNFGLGKRSHLYNFGLGKRSGADEDGEAWEEYDEYPYNEEEDSVPEIDLYHDDVMQVMDKRPKLYSFGLGKRYHKYDFGLGKRGQYRYDFGLGKRSPPPGGRDRLYNFGLGKRTRLYSFGLGKRPFNNGPVPSRFNFGLGKRSDDFDVSKNVIAKREVQKENPQEENAKENLAQVLANKLENSNTTAELESHEIMGHSGKSQLTKRSPYRYSFENGKTTGFRANGRFSRQFRRPLYNFGLGKRNN